MFPRLKPEEVALLTRLGSERSTSANEILFRPCDAVESVFVVLDGCVELVMSRKSEEPLVSMLRPGQFTGDVNLLSGDASLTGSIVREPGRLLEIKRNEIARIPKISAPLSSVFLSSYLLRRADSVSPIATGTLLVGSDRSAGTWRIKAFLERNAVPHRYLDLDRDFAVQWLLEKFAIRPEEIPLLICRGRAVLRNPSNALVANRLAVLSSADNAGLWDIEMAVFSPSGT